MPTLKDDLEMFILDEFFWEDLDGAHPYNPSEKNITAWLDKLNAILRRHPYDLMQLATVRKVNPHIDTLPAPERDGTATAYFKDDPQGKGW